MQDLEEKVDELLDLTKENNKILRRLHRAQKLSTLFRIAYFILIIGVSYGAFVYLKPYMESLMGAYSDGVEQLNTFKDILK